MATASLLQSQKGSSAGRDYAALSAGVKVEQKKWRGTNLNLLLSRTFRTTWKLDALGDWRLHAIFA